MAVGLFESEGRFESEGAKLGAALLEGLADPTMVGLSVTGTGTSVMAGLVGGGVEGRKFVPRGPSFPLSFSLAKTKK